MSNYSLNLALFLFYIRLIYKQNPAFFAHELLFYGKKKRSPNVTFTKIPRGPFVAAASVFEDLFFIPSQFSGWQKSPLALLAMLHAISTFPVFCLHQPTLCPQLLSLLFYEKLLSLWTPTLARMCTPRAPRRGVGFQLSGPKGGFLFQNVWLVNMSPGWKPIPWKTGGMFSNPPQECVRSVFVPHTLLKVDGVNPLPAEVLSVKSKQPRSSLSEICSSN